ncbi:MAG: Hsp70 family protein [Pyrinomonadaceae bacterium]
MPWCAANAQSEITDSQPGIHFILLIDESGSMKSAHRAALVATLPELLYTGRVNGEAFEPELPSFQPGRDQASVVLFTILGGAGAEGCSGGRQRSSALPENMFQLVGVETATRESFADSLGRQMAEPCRFKGNLSPISTAPPLVLPFLQKRLPPDKVFSRTVIVIVTDRQHNTSSSPADELEDFRRPPHNVQDTAEANRLSHAVMNSFHFSYPPSMVKQSGPVFFIVGEVKPLRPPETALSYQRKVEIDRVAQSPDKLRLVAAVPHAADLRILSYLDQHEAAGFHPLRLHMNFEGADGRPWRLWRQKALGEVSAGLAQCRPPGCVDEGDRSTIPLLEVADPDLSISASDPELTPGRLRFTVGLRFQSAIYDHVYVETSEQQIELTPTPRLMLPGVFGLPGTELDNRQLAGLWYQDADGLITQEEAQDRLLAQRNWYWALAVLLAMALVAAALFHLYRTRYKRPFDPCLEGQSASEVVVDFDRPAASRLLVGVLKVVNRGELPWFGQLLHNREQPARAAVVTLDYHSPLIHGLEVSTGNVIGFVGKAGDEGLVLGVEEVVSHGKMFFIFLAAESIRDYVRPGDAEARAETFNLDLTLHIKWGGVRETGQSFPERLRAWLSPEDRGERETVLPCSLTLKPEEPRKPVVTYAASAEPRRFFAKGARREVGRFVFRSQAGHRFAQPFSWGPYAVYTYRDNRSIGGEQLALETPKVLVPPGETIEVPALLNCDGAVVSNPNPESDTYTFRLAGDFDSASEPGPHEATLYRDPTRAGAVVNVIHPAPVRELFWTREGALGQRLRVPDNGGAAAKATDANSVWLGAQEIGFDASTGPYDLIRLELGNSATSGRGLVEVSIVTEVQCDPEVRPGVQMAEGRTLDSLLDVYDFEERASRVVIREGEAPRRITVKLFPSFISRIVGALIPAESFRAVVKLAVRVVTDDGTETRRPPLSLYVPLQLEQLPSPNWLCVDYGTSAIAATWGTGGEDEMLPIPLQEIRGSDKRSYAEFDEENMEKDSRHLLPSWVICNADKRDSNGTAALRSSRPGFPTYLPGSLKPGDAAFVGLPAFDYNFITESDRIIYSVKSWLGKSAQHIRLAKPISYEEDGRVVTRNTLPLDAAIESSFAALIEAYLLAETDYRADRVIICYPNTFTRHHRERLHDIAYRAFGRRFGIERRERIHLISESDAVAYYYCARQMRSRPRSGTERLLVYDFGAGTLDLSLIRVEWQKEPVCYPTGWKVEGRIGVPVAGNYIDEVIARLIDRLLRVLETESPFKYQYRIVDKSYDKKDEAVHRRAITWLWRMIREAKHKWDGNGPLTVTVGVKGGTGVVRPGGDQGELPTAAPPPDRAGVWSDGSPIYLSIPKEDIYSDKRMREFYDFVTNTVIDELLGSAGMPATDVNTVIVSGRGALWPGLRERVWGKFRGAEHPDFDRDAMKSAVVKGAIARHSLNIDFEEAEHATSFRPRLGVLINHNQDIVTEEHWDEPIDLTRSPQFRLVQVNLGNPDPSADMKSLRRHFYIDLDDQVYPRQANNVFIRRGEERNGRFSLYIEDEQGRSRSVFGEARSSQTVTDPPWPVGSLLLNPDE